MVYVFLAEGFEEIEAIFPIDLMRRAGIALKIVGLDSDKRLVKGSHAVSIRTDVSIDTVQIQDAEALVFPGGRPGADNLAANQTVVSLIKTQLASNKLVAAICAAPAFVLGVNGFLKNKHFTCYPGAELVVQDAHYHADKDVVLDGNILTSRGVGTAHKFGEKLIEILVNQEASQKVSQDCLIV